VNGKSGEFTPHETKVSRLKKKGLQNNKGKEQRPVPLSLTFKDLKNKQSEYKERFEK
jgi:hypothetical protein